MKIIKELKNNKVAIKADEGMSIRARGSNDTTIRGNILIYKDDIINYEEVSIEEINKIEAERQLEQEYKSKVESLIRERYTQGDEDAIKRKMLASIVDTNTLSEGQIESILEEFRDYNTFAEECKVKAKEELNKNV